MADTTGLWELLVRAGVLRAGAAIGPLRGDAVTRLWIADLAAAGVDVDPDILAGLVLADRIRADHRARLAELVATVRSVDVPGDVPATSSDVSAAQSDALNESNGVAVVPRDVPDGTALSNSGNGTEPPKSPTLGGLAWWRRRVEHRNGPGARSRI
ncbi:hypothetical protein AB0H71_04260 [Nocardia sp. NPDC050697]|uniref:hypothetical protein n=1 Tax=Nocardia sp. NPDC050697 TaxID=3155158 RepID=UPI0033D0E9D5